MDYLDKQIQAVEARIARLRLLPRGNYSTSSSEEEEEEPARPHLSRGNYSTSSSEEEPPPRLEAKGRVEGRVGARTAVVSRVDRLLDQLSRPISSVCCSQKSKKPQQENKILAVRFGWGKIEPLKATGAGSIDLEPAAAADCCVAPLLLAPALRRWLKDLRPQQRKCVVARSKPTAAASSSSQKPASIFLDCTELLGQSAGLFPT